MPHFDMPLEQLQSYLPTRSEPSDFDEFWQTTLQQAHSYELNATFVPVTTGFNTIDVFDVTFSGFDGQRIKGWLLLPKNTQDPLPCVVNYIGYGGGRGYPHDWLKWSSYGYAHFVMDTRGQGSRWLHGDTPDNASDGQNPQHPGFMTRGISSPYSYYYRRLMTDAVRAVDAACGHPAVDNTKIIVAGGSQGGGLALAVAGLRDDIVAALPDVPFLCNFERAIRLIDTDPYYEIAHYLTIHRDKIEQTLTTLSYFDGMHFAVRASTTALFSVGMMDTICPPSTVYATYNHYHGTKDIVRYEFNNHEGGGSHHTLAQLAFLQEHVPLPNR